MTAEFAFGFVYFTECLMIVPRHFVYGLRFCLALFIFSHFFFSFKFTRWKITQDWVTNRPWACKLCVIQIFSKLFRLLQIITKWAWFETIFHRMNFPKLNFFFEQGLLQNTCQTDYNWISVVLLSLAANAPFIK